MKRILVGIFIIGLIYILAPGPSTIDEFRGLPNSLKSKEPGDTVQVPNIAAYFSDFQRAEITDFYRDEYRKNFIFGRLPPITLNYPPIAAYQYVRDLLQLSTFLEEYVYPLKGSIFVNGYEQAVMRQIRGQPPKPNGDFMEIEGQLFKSKTTIRYYPSAWHVALITYLGIWAVGFYLIKFFQEAKKA